MQNLFCKRRNIGNEATVEARFVDPLLKTLGYSDDDIRLKTSIKELKVGKGSKSVLYKPDYVLAPSKIPSVVVDAKATSEKIEDYEYQCSSYCLEINKGYEYNPVQHYILSNGIKTAVYKWDKRNPILELDFSDFTKGNPKLEELIIKVGKKAISSEMAALKNDIDKSDFKFEKVSLPELSSKFQKMHKHIWTKEKMSPSAAFEELIKIVFVKIQKDQELREKIGSSKNPIYEDVVFSTHWITNQTENESPVNDPLFRNLVKSLEEEIRNDKKKRFFDEDEEITLSKETIRWIVSEIQHVDFVAVEDDIHGRMFETFLDATIRGRDLGQFFTPRNIVVLMVRLADITVSKEVVETVLDACCGSGGFLIAAMADMRNKADALAGLSTREQKLLIDRIANRSLFGIDAGTKPAICKIARMNMYLHGDGGTNIYHADSLDKQFGGVGKASIENKKQLNELRKMILENGKRFDVILSNPPFSMKFKRNDEEHAAILNQYEIGVDKKAGKVLNSVLSSVMFLERYKDLVSEEGKILAIIDDSVLSGSSYGHVRGFIRDTFVIIAIISLPGDAFRRASARVKTSILVLRPKIDGEAQGDVFMASTVLVGLEEKVAKRIGAFSPNFEKDKRDEANHIVSQFKDFKNGKRGSYVVAATKITDRLDVKFCIGNCGRKKRHWASQGFVVVPMDAVLSPASGRKVTVTSTDVFQFLRVNYDGEVIEGDLIEGEECSYSYLFKVQAWDILMSNMGVGRGAIGIVPPFQAGKFVSNEYTILTTNSNEEAVYYSNLIRTKEILGDILSSTTGMNRGRIKWDNVAKVDVPEYVKGNKDIKEITQKLKELWDNYETFSNLRQTHMEKVVTELDVDGEDAQKRWLAFKPPE